MTALHDRARTVLDAIEEHAFSDTDREVGGVLVGTLDEAGAQVHAALPALRAVGAQTNVTFTHEVWQEVLAAVDRDHPNQRIVGWYHTHPGFGLFLSDYDKFIHHNFFSDPRMVALVVDPLAGQMGWFGWEGDALPLREAHPTVRPALRPAGDAAPHASAGHPSRVRAMLVPLSAAALLAAIGGYVLGARVADHDSAAQTRRLAAAHADAAQARAEAGQLRQQLATKVTGAAPPATAENPSARQDPVRYRVRHGDTLWGIAVSLYGDGALYPRIAAANPGARPGALNAGQILRVPVPPQASASPRR